MENETMQEHPEQTGRRPDWKSLWAKYGTIICVALVILLAVSLILDVALLTSRNRQETEIPEGKTVAALEASATLLAQLKQGDIVTVFDMFGKPVEALRYVEVYGTGTDGILLLLDDVQTDVFMGKVDCKAALVAHGGTDLLDLQERINHPVITLKLPETVTVAPEEELQMEYTVSIEPKEATLPKIQWSGSNWSVAWVNSEGVVTGIAPGEMVITATCGTVSAQCSVLVEVPLTGIRISETAIEMAPGAGEQLTAIPEPEDASGFSAAWESSAPEIVKVSEQGYVTAVAEGTAVITARCGTWSAECTVTVKQRASYAKLDVTNLVLKAGETAQLTAEVQPTIADDDVITWACDTPSVATVDENGLVTAIAPGTALITYKCGAATAYCTLLVNPGAQ